MNDVYTFGPFLIQQTWLIGAVGVLIGFVLLRLYPVHESKRTLESILVHALLYFLVVWQFSTVLFRWDLLLSDPLAVLSYPSGSKELHVALLVLGGYVAWQSRQLQMAWSTLVAGLITVIAPAALIYFFLDDARGFAITAEWLSFLPLSHHPLAVYRMLVYLLIVLYVLTNIHRTQPTVFIRRVMIGWGVSHWLISMVDPVPTWLGASISPLYYSVLAISGIAWEIGVYITKRRNKND